MATMMTLCGILLISAIVLKILLKVFNVWRRGNRDYLTVAFFHPYCNAGGGGERVLWSAIKGLQSRYSSVEIYVYTVGSIAPEAILSKAELRFGITLKKSPKFVNLATGKLLEAKLYPIATLLLQSLGSIIVAMEAYFAFCPDIYIDTMGYTFTNIVFKLLAESSTICYTHYPTISSEMIEKVSSHSEAHNNQGFIARNPILSCCKLYYYQLFAVIYGWLGRMNDIVMVNSSWTRGHISSLWKCESKLFCVYPPCDLDSFLTLESIPDDQKPTENIVSIGQFRPEKDYPLQLKSFRVLLDTLGPERGASVRLVLIGGVRNTEDQDRVASLKLLAEQLHIDQQVKWLVNAPFNVLLDEVKSGIIGLHSMWNEHFGISVVECMAGGLVMVAHDSGGPKEDIVIDKDGQRTGFLASTKESYAQHMKNILDMSNADRNSIISSAKASSKRFGEDVFIQRFIEVTEKIFLSRLPV